MKIVNTCLLFLCLLVTSILSSCSEPIQLYFGPKLPSNEIALLKPCSFTCQDVEYFIIDGKDVTKSPLWPADVHILPGKHEIKWATNEPRGNFSYKGHGILNARAGVEYLVTYTYKTGNTTTLNNRTILDVTFHRTWIFESGKGFTQDWEDLIYPNSTEVNPNVHFF